MSSGQCFQRCATGERATSLTSHLSAVSRASAGWGVYCSIKFAAQRIWEALPDELAPLGIQATVIEPGFFRTDFTDNRSLARTGRQIDDHTKTVGKTRIFAVERNHQPPGDPAKLAQALLRLANAAKPPLRLALGTNARAGIAAKNSFVALARGVAQAVPEYCHRRIRPKIHSQIVNSINLPPYLSGAVKHSYANPLLQ
jgi:NAD(P)-dependent dehydrogenase (short-subunit alcohol dehydrogenase family)